VEGAAEFDLKGFSEASARAFIPAAFAEPLDAPQPVRCTFLVGGGKKVRQKYEPDLGKWLADALNQLGFEEDRAASAVEECQRTYKQQHDTDKDLKYLHVFPAVSIGRAGAGGASSSDTGGQKGVNLLGFNQEVLEVACMSLAELMGRARENEVGEGGPWLRGNAPTFSQRRALLRSLKEVQAQLELAEQSLAHMEELTPPLQQLYDAAQQVPEKIERLNLLLEGMLAHGLLTAAERAAMLEDLREKKHMLEAQIEEAKASEKPAEKKLARLQKQLETVEEKQAAVSRIQPVRLSCKHAKRMKAVRAELVDIYKIEANRNLQDMNTIKKLYKKDDLIRELQELEADVLGWFKESLVRQCCTHPPAATIATLYYTFYSRVVDHAMLAARGGQQGPAGIVRRTGAEGDGHYPMDDACGLFQ